MKALRLTLPLLLLSFAALAAEPVMLLQNQGRPGDSSFSYRQEFSAVCSAPSVGDCSACTVSCATGQAAVCKPGKVLAATGDGTCQREPSCTCQSATPPAVPKAR